MQGREHAGGAHHRARSTRASTRSSPTSRAPTEARSTWPSTRRRSREPAPPDTERPKVVSAGSPDNKHVVVQFSKPMADNTADTSRYTIVQTVTHPEVGALAITAAEFVAGTDRKSVRLTTLSQAEVTYQVTVNNVTDVIGEPPGRQDERRRRQRRPDERHFAGTPPAPGDYREQRLPTRSGTTRRPGAGRSSIKFADGNSQVRQVTSSPFAADTDGDGLKDHEERALEHRPPRPRHRRRRDRGRGRVQRLLHRPDEPGRRRRRPLRRPRGRTSSSRPRCSTTPTATS